MLLVSCEGEIYWTKHSVSEGSTKLSLFLGKMITLLTVKMQKQLRGSVSAELFLCVIQVFWSKLCGAVACAVPRQIHLRI